MNKKLEMKETFDEVIKKYRDKIKKEKIHTFGAIRVYNFLRDKEYCVCLPDEWQEGYIPEELTFDELIDEEDFLNERSYRIIFNELHQDAPWRIPKDLEDDISPDENVYFCRTTEELNTLCHYILENLIKY